MRCNPGGNGKAIHRWRSDLVAPRGNGEATGYCGGQCFYDIAIGVTPDNQTIHLAGAAGNSSANCGSNVMKRSTNGGTTFVSNDATLHADGHAIAIAPSNPQIVYTGNDGGIWRSLNNGNTWQTSTRSISAPRSFRVWPCTPLTGTS